MLLTLLIAFIDPPYDTMHRDFILEEQYSSPKDRQIIYLAANDINKAVGCQVINVKTVAFVDFDHNIITFNPEALEKEEEDDLAMTFQRGPLVKIGIRQRMHNEKLYYVAIHELGHALSLDHVNDRKSVMYPYVFGAYPNVSNHHKIYRKWRYRWSHQISNLLKAKKASICTDR